MYCVRQSVLVRSFLLPLALLVCLSSCYRWTSIPAPAAPSDNLPSAVRVTLRGGREVVLRDPYLKADSLIGQDETTPSVRLAFHTDSVWLVERRDVDAIKTTEAVVVGIGAAAAVYTMVSLSQADFFPWLEQP